MKCDHCTRPASQEYPIDGEWYPVCDVCAPTFGGLRPLTTPHSILQQAQKGDLSLLPGGPLNSVALAIASGLDKYPRDDWKREDLNLQEYASKAIRHTYEWLEGRDADPESGVDPLAHAVADLLFVIWHNQNWSGKAKRPGAEVSDG